MSSSCNGLKFNLGRFSLKNHLKLTVSAFFLNFSYFWKMLKKIFLAVGSLLLAFVIVTVIPITSFVKDETASDTIILVGSILIALTIYKLVSSKFIK
ncbi:hypothetical protein KAOT1_18862 [Kordia algicida OT-1]|uniref:Uncharacterized protein n=2 Tax=Kordia TaxID=221065 RepID=A9DNQ9_9FLAO|nr:hypothetical protein KAOT1_18862 [Kordia algicida OT-1]